MDYERKHKEEVVRATQLWKNRDITREQLEYIFPELEESEGEKARKELYDFCIKCSHGDTLVNQQADFQRWATWLEKQGKSKFEQCTQEGDKIVTNEDGTRFNVSQLERVAKKETKKIDLYCQKNCKGYQETGRCFADGECQAKKYAEFAWSEEDENKVTLFMQLTEGCDNEDELADWLKSLKDRMKGE